MMAGLRRLVHMPGTYDLAAYDSGKLWDILKICYNRTEADSGKLFGYSTYVSVLSAS